MTRNDYVRLFDHLSLDDLPLVGGKTASLGEPHRLLMCEIPNNVSQNDTFAKRAPGVLEMLRQTAAAHRNGQHVGICGEAPATYPEIAGYLTCIGIDSMSVNPQSPARTLLAVSQAELDLGARAGQPPPPAGVG
ncbi:MAG: putative PEP-binding protein [Pseudomonadota bacterium]